MASKIPEEKEGRVIVYDGRRVALSFSVFLIVMSLLLGLGDQRSMGAAAGAVMSLILGCWLLYHGIGRGPSNAETITREEGRGAIPNDYRQQ